MLVLRKGTVINIPVIAPVLFLTILLFVAWMLYTQSMGQPAACYILVASTLVFVFPSFYYLRWFKRQGEYVECHSLASSMRIRLVNAIFGVNKDVWSQVLQVLGSFSRVDQFQMRKARIATLSDSQGGKYFVIGLFFSSREFFCLQKSFYRGLGWPVPEKVTQELANIAEADRGIRRFFLLLLGIGVLPALLIIALIFAIKALA